MTEQEARALVEALFPILAVALPDAGGTRWMVLIQDQEHDPLILVYAARIVVTESEGV